MNDAIKTCNIANDRFVIKPQKSFNTMLCFYVFRNYVLIATNSKLLQCVLFQNLFQSIYLTYIELAVFVES